MLFKKNRISKFLTDNTGAAIVTVIIVVAFISLLSTTILYLSGVNYRMKVTDYTTKETFYESEEITEILRARLIEDASVAAREAFKDVASRYVLLSSEDFRASAYEEAFFDELYETWSDHWLVFDDVTGVDVLDVPRGIRHYFPAATGIDYDSDSGVCTFYYDGMKVVINDTYAEMGSSPFTYVSSLRRIAESSTNELATLVGADASTPQLQEILKSYVWYQDYYCLSNFNITVTDMETAYSSIIKTSYYVVPPELNWKDNELPSGMQEVNFEDCVNYLNWSKQ